MELIKTVYDIKQLGLNWEEQATGLVKLLEKEGLKIVCVLERSKKEDYPVRDIAFSLGHSHPILAEIDEWYCLEIEEREEGKVVKLAVNELTTVVDFMLQPITVRLTEEDKAMREKIRQIAGDYNPI
ncbi:MAG: hypothetical protein KAT77_06100 [Nanoarchaeota archaeon]|nr:hypothetical protein [Nanoarchaeota archaeon]